MSGCPVSVDTSSSSHTPWNPCPGWAVVHPACCIPPTLPRAGVGLVVSWERDPPEPGWQPHGAGSCCHLEPPGWISQKQEWVGWVGGLLVGALPAPP